MNLSNLPPGVTDSMIEDQVGDNRLHDALVDKLQELVDTNGLYEVIQCLIEVCYAKEDEVRDKGDDYYANLWSDASSQLEKLNISV